MKDFTNLAKTAQQVLLIQDACNSRAVINIFPKVMRAVVAFDQRLGTGTEAYNTHPYILLMLDKLVQLAGGRVDWYGRYNFSSAYDYTSTDDAS